MEEKKKKNRWWEWETPGTYIINLVYVVLATLLFYLAFWDLSTIWGVQ